MNIHCGQNLNFDIDYTLRKTFVRTQIYIGTEMSSSRFVHISIAQNQRRRAWNLISKTVIEHKWNSLICYSKLINVVDLYMRWVKRGSARLRGKFPGFHR